MPTQAPQWTEFLSCPICYNVFNERLYRPISLGCGHTVCRLCLGKLHQKKCPFDQSLITRDVEDLPVNFALLQLVGVAVPEETLSSPGLAEHAEFYLSAKRCIEELAILLKPVSTSPGSLGANASVIAATAVLSRPMQRKLVALVNCQLVEEEGRARAMRAARSLGERTVTEMILQHQNAQQLSANLWAAVRARGCQFLGPAMQEEVLKLILLALEDGSALSRKVLVLFVVQRLASQYPQASKTAIGHVVQLLYRASCFKVTKREEESSLMQLKEEFRTYEALRREHDSQIVQIATEAGLRISPEQWSSLLYGDTAHKSHMQSIIDKLQTPQSFVQSVNELAIALQRSGDPGNLSRLRPHYELLANIDPLPDTPPPSWENLEAVMKAVKTVVQGLVEFSDNTGGQRKTEPLLAQGNTKYKTHMCRDLAQKGRCPRGTNCTFAHSQEEMERYRLRSKRLGKGALNAPIKVVTSSALSPSEHQQLAAVARAAQDKMLALAVGGDVEHITLEQGHGPIAGMARMGVTVPVMKPSALPASMKIPPIRQTIYTSPTATSDDDHHTELVPITNRVPAMHTQPVQTMFGNPGVISSPVNKQIHHVPQGHGLVPAAYREQNTYMPMHTHPPNTGLQGGGRGTYMPDPTSLPMGMNPQDLVQGQTYYAGAMTVHGVEAGQEARYSGEETMKNIVSLPPNPYTSESHDIPTRDSHYYLTSNVAKFTRGKSPSQQLGELHQRRNELIAQLTKTKTPDGVTAVVNGTRESARSPGTYPPVAQVMPRPSSNAMQNPSRCPTSLANSVADSMATTLTTMSIAKATKEDLTETTIPVASGYAETHYDSVNWPRAGHTYDEPEDFSPVEELHYPQQSYESWTVTTGFIHEKEDPVYWDDDDESPKGFEDEADDEFVPFEHNVVSKYGPISRMAKAKLKATGPLQVTAAQTNDVTAVTAVTPIKRPYPISAQVPSRFSQGSGPVPNEEPVTEPAPNPVSLPQGQSKIPSHDHIADPGGMQVATSLPTALMQPNLIAVSNKREPHTLWALRERLGGDFGRNSTCEASNSRFVNLPGQAVIGVSETPQDEICYELQRLNEQIESLQTSEDERLARELQAIELNIQETERKIQHGGTEKREAEKRAQVEQDRRLAQQIVLHEARQKGLSMKNEGQPSTNGDGDKVNR